MGNGIKYAQFCILLQLAEFYEVDVGELLDGKRKEKISHNETKELLSKISDYTESKEKNFANICNKITLTTFVAQLIIYGNIKYIIGEIIATMIGGSALIFMSVKNGLWSIAANQKDTPLRDIITSGVIAIIFTIAAASLIFSKTDNYKITAYYSLLLVLPYYAFLQRQIKRMKTNRNSKQHFRMMLPAEILSHIRQRCVICIVSQIFFHFTA